MNKSFTLIEILVVIVVIGVLSAFILVGMSSISDKANIAKGQAFINSMDNALLLSRVSYWKLNESSGTTANDSWSTNNGTLSGATIPLIQTSGCVSDNCLSFNGSTSYVNLNTFPSISNLSAYAVSAWVKVTVGGSTEVILGYGSSTIDTPIIDIGMSSANKAIFQHRDDANNLTYAIGSNTINDNKWHLVTGVRYASNNHRIFVDGIIQPQTDTNTIGTTTVNKAAIGILPRTTNVYPWNGWVDDVRIYNSAVPVSQVEQNYYAGLNKLLINSSIYVEEFGQRFSEFSGSLADN